MVLTHVFATFKEVEAVEIQDVSDINYYLTFSDNDSSYDETEGSQNS